MKCYNCNVEIPEEQVGVKEIDPGDHLTPPEYINVCPHCDKPLN